MIEIIEHGQSQLTENKKYITACDRCGCKFIFETKDMCAREKRFGVHGSIACPEEGCDMIVRVDDPMEVYEDNFSREKFVEEIEKIFGTLDIFLDIVEDGGVGGYDMIKDNDEIYIIDENNCQYIHWYKLTHVGRDFHSDIKTWDGIVEFLKRLKKKKEDMDKETE